LHKQQNTLPYAGLFSFVTALQIGARLWRDVLARKPEKPCKYCEFCVLMICFISSFLPDDPHFDNLPKQDAGTGFWFKSWVVF
jgi:hypothetical protein